MGINFSFQTTFTLKNRMVLKQWIKNTIEANNKEMGDISYIFCSDDQLLDINKEFLNHDYYTDVINYINISIYFIFKYISSNICTHQQFKVHKYHLNLF